MENQETQNVEKQSATSVKKSVAQWFTRNCKVCDFSAALPCWRTNGVTFGVKIGFPVWEPLILLTFSVNAL